MRNGKKWTSSESNSFEWEKDEDKRMRKVSRNCFPDLLWKFKSLRIRFSIFVYIDEDFQKIKYTISASERNFKILSFRSFRKLSSFRKNVKLITNLRHGDWSILIWFEAKIHFWPLNFFPCGRTHNFVWFKYLLLMSFLNVVFC